MKKGNNTSLSILIWFSVLGAATNAASFINFFRILSTEPPISVLDPLLDGWIWLANHIFSAIPSLFGINTPLWLDLMWAVSFIGVGLFARMLTSIFYVWDLHPILPSREDITQPGTETWVTDLARLVFSIFVILCLLILGLAMVGWLMIPAVFFTIYFFARRALAGISQMGFRYFLRTRKPYRSQVGQEVIIASLIGLNVIATAVVILAYIVTISF